MLRHTLKLLTVAATLLVLFVAASDEKKTTIFIIGDSTAANKDISKGKLERGWGMALQCYFDDNIRVDNHAVNGRSSLSFFNEGRWAKVLEKMKPGDYVIIQIGHNDEKAPEFTISGMFLCATVILEAASQVPISHLGKLTELTMFPFSTKSIICLTAVIAQLSSDSAVDAPR
mgnify:CR=1 FL=1